MSVLKKTGVSVQKYLKAASLPQQWSSLPAPLAPATCAAPSPQALMPTCELLWRRRRPQRLPFSLPNLTTLSVLSPPPARPTASPRRSSQACTAVATSDNPPLCVRRSKLHKFVMLDIATGRQSLFWRSFGSSCCCLQIIPAPWQPSSARCLDSTNIVTAAAFQALALAANEIITNKS